MATQKKKAVSKRKKPPGRPNGRPTKLTKPVADRIADGVALGMTFKEAAKAGGIHEHTLETMAHTGLSGARFEFDLCPVYGASRQGGRKDGYLLPGGGAEVDYGKLGQGA